MKRITNCPKCKTNYRKDVKAMNYEGEILTLCPKDGSVMFRQLWSPLFYPKDKIMAQLARTSHNYLNGDENGLAVCAMLEAHDWLAYESRRQAREAP